MAAMNELEEKLNEVFVDKAPFQIPDDARKTIVNILPWLNLVFGILILWTAYGLYTAAKVVDQWVDYANSISKAYGGGAYAAQSSRLSAIVWISIIVLVVEGVLWLAAFPGVKDKKKSGWNILFIALLINIVYGFVSIFSDVRGGIGSFIGYAIGSVIGLYLLFQIRSVFLPAKKAAVSATTNDKKPAEKSDKK